MNLKIWSISFLFLLFSCASKKDILYLQNLNKNSEREINQNYASVLQPDDILSITVSTKDNVGIQPFNTVANEESGSGAGSQYIIREDGTIEFPVLGNLKLAGLTPTEAIALIKKELLLYLKEPIVLLEWKNFKFTVLGEVASPGVYGVGSEKVTIFEAIGKAGDLTLSGNRKDITLIRETNGVQKYFNIDLTNTDILSSEAYYVKQNDVIIIPPNKAQIQSSGFKNLPVYISIASILITVIVLITR